VPAPTVLPLPASFASDLQFYEARYLPPLHCLRLFYSSQTPKSKQSFFFLIFRKKYIVPMPIFQFRGSILSRGALLRSWESGSCGLARIQLLRCDLSDQKTARRTHIGRPRQTFFYSTEVLLPSTLFDIFQAVGICRVTCEHLRYCHETRPR
jgi:hypothetical protein